MMIETIYQDLVGHFSGRDDLADVIIGPEREDWFNGEAIAGIGKKHQDWWVYGEMTYGDWSERLELDSRVVAGCERRKPDLFCVERETEVMTLLGEAKLVRRSTDAAPFGTGEKGLLAQLDRAHRFVDRLRTRNITCPKVCGIIYGLYNPANMFRGVGEEDPGCPGLSVSTDFETASPDAFFKWIGEQWDTQRDARDWRLWREAVQYPSELQNLSPKYSNIASSLSVGVGIVLHRTNSELNVPKP